MRSQGDGKVGNPHYARTDSACTHGSSARTRVGTLGQFPSRKRLVPTESEAGRRLAAVPRGDRNHGSLTIVRRRVVEMLAIMDVRSRPHTWRKARATISSLRPL